ncbi:MAG: hypothetical protein FJW34_00085 [Acidobacteria bacterium]|nr:hypothetical protein [Acidobacteriota bacterium]
MPRTARDEDTGQRDDDVTLIAPPDQDGEETPPAELREGGEGEEKKGAEDARDKELKELRRQIRGERKRIRELEESERAWAERARGRGDAGQTPPAKADATEEEPELDVIEALTSEGVKGLDKVLKKLGYARVEELDAKIEKTRTQLTKDARLLGRFPDLGDENSDFFKATARRYEGLSQNPGIKDSGMLMELAAELAEGDLGLRRASKDDRRRQRDADLDDEEDRDDGQETEADRVRRVQAQAGSRGRGSAREGADDDELTPLQKRIAARFGITEEAYRKRAKSGVQMSGLPRR